MFIKAEDSTNIVKKIIKITRQTGVGILNFYENGSGKFYKKHDNTILTKADIYSHNIICKKLKQITPNIPILSEESVKKPNYNIRKHWSQYWLIDPLDGTRSFVDKTGEFCISIAYIQNNRPAFGLIYAPVSKTHFYAISGKNAYKHHNNVTIKIVAKPEHKPLEVVIGRYSESNKSLQQHLKKITKYNITKLGSALKFAYIASGKYDYYPNFGNCSQWDTAAGVCIVEASGGSVVDVSGNILYYNKSDDLYNKNFIARGNCLK